MRALFIGGTGTISTAITNKLATEGNWELYLINRGLHSVEIPANVKVITADINNEADVAEKIKDLTFDTVCDFIGFVPEQLERDYRLKNKTIYVYQLGFSLSQTGGRISYHRRNSTCQSILGIFQK